MSSFLPQDGLAGELVRSIAKTLDGDLWFACWGRGISRFDGYTFTNYDEGEGLPSRDVRCPRPRLGRPPLVRHDPRPLAYFDGKRWHPVPTGLPGLLNTPSVFAITTSKAGKLWVSCEGGFLRLEPDPRVRLSLARRRVVPPPCGQSAPRRLDRRRSAPRRGPTPRYGPFSPLPTATCGSAPTVSDSCAFKVAYGSAWTPDVASPDGVIALSEGPDGTVWAAQRGQLAGYSSRGKQTIPIRSGSVTCLLPIEDGSLYVGTDMGLRQYEDGRWKDVSLGEADDLAPPVTVASYGSDEVWGRHPLRGLPHHRKRLGALQHPRAASFSARRSACIRTSRTPPLSVDTLGTFFQWDGAHWQYVMKLDGEYGHSLGPSKPIDGKTWILATPKGGATQLCEVSLTEEEASAESRRAAGRGVAPFLPRSRAAAFSSTANATSGSTSAARGR